MKKLFFILYCSALASMTVDTFGSNLLSLYEEYERGTIEELLKDSNVDVNQADNNGTTLLLAACKNRDSRLVESILKRSDVDVNKADNDENTPLLEAVRYNGCNFNLGTIELLLERGALNKANRKGETPLTLSKGTLIYSYLEFHFTKKATKSPLCSGLD